MPLDTSAAYGAGGLSLDRTSSSPRAEFAPSERFQLGGNQHGSIGDTQHAASTTHAADDPPSWPGGSAWVSDYTSLLDISLFDQSGIERSYIQDFTKIPIGTPPTEDATLNAGHPAFMTYSIQTSLPEGLATTYGKDIVATFQKFTNAEANMIRAAVNDWASQCGITAVEVPSGKGSVEFSAVSLAGMEASGLKIFDEYTGITYVNIDPGVLNSGDTSSIDYVLLHEVGHAIGLKHPFGPPSSTGIEALVLDPSLDNFSNTVMSYTDDGSGGGVLGPFDIQAAQYMYGTKDAIWDWNASTYTLTQTGTASDDEMAGTATHDIIHGGAGNDIIEGEAGNDKLYGGAGNDQLFPGTGTDKIYGNSGDDTIVVQTAKFTVDGGKGTDTLNISVLDPKETTLSLADMVASGTIKNIESINVYATVYKYQTGQGLVGWNSFSAQGSDLPESFFISRGDNATGDIVVHGGGGNDIISISDSTGTKGASLYGDDGDDKLHGTDSNDFIDGGAGNDAIFGNGGSDTAGYGDATSGVTVSLLFEDVNSDHQDAWQNTGGAGTDILDGIENLDGSNYADVLTGDKHKNTLTGEGGNDTLKGGGSADHLIGGAGKDTYVYKAASDSTGATYDTITGFNAEQDAFKMPSAVTGVDAALTSGKLSKASFDADLAKAVNASHLAAHHAVEFTPTTGTLKGDHFLIIDVNGHAGYQAGQDLVIELSGATHLSSLSASDFVT